MLVPCSKGLFQQQRSWLSFILRKRNFPLNRNLRSHVVSTGTGSRERRRVLQTIYRREVWLRSLFILWMASHGVGQDLFFRKKEEYWFRLLALVKTTTTKKLALGSTIHLWVLGSKSPVLRCIMDLHRLSWKHQEAFCSPVKEVWSNPGD